MSAVLLVVAGMQFYTGFFLQEANVTYVWSDEYNKCSQLCTEKYSVQYKGTSDFKEGKSHFNTHTMSICQSSYQFKSSHTDCMMSGIANPEFYFVTTTALFQRSQTLGFKYRQKTRTTRRRLPSQTKEISHFPTIAL